VTAARWSAIRRGSTAASHAHRPKSGEGSRRWKRWLPSAIGSLKGHADFQPRRRPPADCREILLELAAARKPGGPNSRPTPGGPCATTAWIAAGDCVRSARSFARIPWPRSPSGQCFQQCCFAKWACPCRPVPSSQSEPRRPGGFFLRKASRGPEKLMRMRLLRWARAKCLRYLAPFSGWRAARPQRLRIGRRLIGVHGGPVFIK